MADAEDDRSEDHLLALTEDEPITLALAEGDLLALTEGGDLLTLTEGTDARTEGRTEGALPTTEGNEPRLGDVLR